MNRALPKRLRWFLVLLLTTQVFAQSTAPTFPNPGKTSMSKQDQEALGMQVAAKVYEQMPVLPDNSPETQYVRQLGQKLVSTIPQEYSWPFAFHVVPQKEINAFALPGGQMFINIGTITAAKNEGELAGVMAHEMSHVYMQHSAKQASKGQTTSMIAGITSAVLGGVAGGPIGQLAQMGIQMGAQGLMMKYSRGDESQADAVGAVILYKSGYNPQSMADFFQTLGSQGGSAPPQFLSSHPNPANRQQAIQKQIAQWPPQTFATDSPSFAQLRQHAAGLRAYTAQEIQQGAQSGQWAALNQRNGASLNSSGASAFPTRASADANASAGAVTLENVLPSQRMVNADLGPIRIRRPENWPVKLPEQQGQFVTIAPEAGITNNGVGYGVLLNGAAAPPRRMNIDEMTNQVIQRLQQQNGVEPVGNPKPITVAGIESRATLLRSASPFSDANGQPRQETDLLVTLPMQDGGLIYMIFIAPESDFRRFQPTFEAMVRSVQLK